MTTKSTLLRMDNVLIVVNDMPAVKAFFIELGMKLEGETQVEGPWVDRVIGVDGSCAEIAILKTPDGNSRVELSRFITPHAVDIGQANAAANTLGIRRLMFAVTAIDELVSRLCAKHDSEVVGEVVQYSNAYRLCYLRGPEGIVVGLADPLVVPT